MCARSTSQSERAMPEWFEQGSNLTDCVPFLRPERARALVQQIPMFSCFFTFIWNVGRGHA